MSSIDSYPPLLVEFFQQLSCELQKNDIEKPLATDVAKNVVDSLRRNLGGSMMYIPKGKLIDSDEKCEAIRKAFTGKNHQELSTRYGVCIQSIYRIVKTKKTTK